VSSCGFVSCAKHNSNGTSGGAFDVICHPAAQIVTPVIRAPVTIDSPLTKSASYACHERKSHPFHLASTLLLHRRVATRARRRASGGDPRVIEEATPASPLGCEISIVFPLARIRIRACLVRGTRGSQRPLRHEPSRTRSINLVNSDSRRLWRSLYPGRIRSHTQLASPFHTPHAQAAASLESRVSSVA